MQNLDARQEYILPLDADDRIHRSYIEKITFWLIMAFKHGFTKLSFGIKHRVCFLRL
jgi:hypothetical protein